MDNKSLPPGGILLISSIRFREALTLIEGMIDHHEMAPISRTGKLSNSHRTFIGNRADVVQ